MFNSNRGETEGTKMMSSNQIALNKRNDGDMSSEENVSKNLYTAIDPTLKGKRVCKLI